MHFHHRHDLAGCTDAHTDWPDWAVTVLATIDRQGLILMTAVQDQIDALTARLASAAADLTAVVDAASVPAEPAPDLSALQAAVEQVVALVPAPAAAPVDAAPADVPAADVPVADPVTAELPAVAADGTVPAQGIPSVPLA